MGLGCGAGKGNGYDSSDKDPFWVPVVVNQAGVGGSRRRKSWLVVRRQRSYWNLLEPGLGAVHWYQRRFVSAGRNFLYYLDLHPGQFDHEESKALAASAMVLLR
jgi:hypothetical protein